MAAIERTAWAIEAPRKPTRSRPGRWHLVSLWWTRAAAQEHCDYKAGQRVRIRRQRVESWRAPRPDRLLTGAAS